MSQSNDAAGSIPAELVQLGGVSRRDFLSRSVMVAVAAALCDACGGPLDFSSTTAPGGGTGGVTTGFTVALSSYPALATVGGIARVSGGSIPIAVVRVSDTAFSAYSMVCPHQGTTINVQGSGFVCPNHGARFDASGAWVGGQVTNNLTSIPVTYDAAAQTITIDPTGVSGGNGGGNGGGTGGGTGGGVGSGTLIVTLSSFPALSAVGGIARVDGGSGTPVAVVRSGQSSYAAFSMVCPHQGTTINISNGAFVCPNHGARFSAAGQWTGGQSTSNLVSLAVTVDQAAGTLTVNLSGAPTGGGGGGGGEDDD